MCKLQRFTVAVCTQDDARPKYAEIYVTHSKDGNKRSHTFQWSAETQLAVSIGIGLPLLGNSTEGSQLFTMTSSFTGLAIIGCIHIEIGHTRLTNYLLKRENQPKCQICHSPYTGKHILIDCICCGAALSEISWSWYTLKELSENVKSHTSLLLLKIQPDLYHCM